LNNIYNNLTCGSKGLRYSKEILLDWMVSSSRFYLIVVKGIPGHLQSQKTKNAEGSECREEGKKLSLSASKPFRLSTKYWYYFS
jgi:hypothetical protein